MMGTSANDTYAMISKMRENINAGPLYKMGQAAIDMYDTFAGFFDRYSRPSTPAYSHARV